MAEEKKNERLTKHHDNFEDGSTTSDKTSFSEGSRRLDPPRTTDKPKIKPKPNLPIRKKIHTSVPRVDGHGQERTREIPAGQERESPLLQSASLQPVLPNSLPVQSQEDSDSPKLRRTLLQLQDDVSSISERVRKLEVKGQDVAMPKAIQHETPSATITTQPPGKQLPQLTSMDTQLGNDHNLTEFSKTMAHMQETQRSMQKTQMSMQETQRSMQETQKSMQETQKGMQKEIQGHSEAIKTLTDKVDGCQRSISEHDDVIGDLKDKVEKLSVSMQSSPDDVEKLHLSEQESTKTHSYPGDQVLKKNGQPETALHKAAVIHRSSYDPSNKQKVESNAKESQILEEDGETNLYGEKQSNVVKLVIKLEGSSVSKDLPQPQLQVEPTVARNVQVGESESTKRISCEETGKDKGELCAQK